MKAGRWGSAVTEVFFHFGDYKVQLKNIIKLKIEVAPRYKLLTLLTLFTLLTLLTLFT